MTGSLYVVQIAISAMAVLPASKAAYSLPAVLINDVSSGNDRVIAAELASRLAQLLAYIDVQRPLVNMYAMQQGDVHLAGIMSMFTSAGFRKLVSAHMSNKTQFTDSIMVLTFHQPF